MKALEQAHKDDLEGLIDTYGLSAVVEALGEIAYDKAQHIHDNWQDKGLAKSWTKASNRILAARTAIVGLGL